MILMIDPPVSVFSTVDEVRDWIVALEAMRDRYRGDAEALLCIAHAGRDAEALLELIPTLPKLEPDAKRGRG